MNKARRKELAAIIDLMEEVKDRLEAVKGEEEEAFYNLPESIQNSERGEAMEANIYTIEELLDALDIDGLQEIIDG